MEIVMKKILISLLATTLLASSLMADMARIELGLGSWSQTPSGTAKYTDGALTGSDVSAEESQNELYFWTLVKHPIPVIPNIRIEYVSALNEGSAIGTFGSVTLPVKTKTELELQQFDLIPYYNILDNTGWLTLDLGIDAKIINISYEAAGEDLVSAIPSDISSVVVPLAYVRTRVQVPGTDLGAEADIKYITYEDVTAYDVRVKVDYTLDMIPVVQPGLEFGYRLQKFDIEDSGFVIDTEYAGVYVGLMTRF
jgi:outer membrane protein